MKHSPAKVSEFRICIEEREPRINVGLAALIEVCEEIEEFFEFSNLIIIFSMENKRHKTHYPN